MIIVSSIKQLCRLLANTEIEIVCIAAIASAGPTSLLPIVLAVITTFWGIRWVAFGRPTLSTPTDFPLVLLVLMIPVTLAVSLSRETTLVQVSRLLIGIGLFYAIVNWATSISRVKLLVYGAVAVCAILAVSAPLSMPTQLTGVYSRLVASVYPQSVRILDLTANTSNPNVIAGMLVILLPYPIALLLFAGRRFGWLSRIGIAMTILVGAPIIVLTHSRGAQLALGAAALALLMMKRKRSLLVLLAGSLIIGIIALWNQADSTLAFSSIGLNGRSELWARAVFMIEDFPLSGTGMGSFPTIVTRLYPLSLNTAHYDHAHNLFLQVAVDLGIPGLVAWTAALLMIVTCSWQVYCTGCRDMNVWATAIGTACVCSQIAFVVHGLTDAATWGVVRTTIVPFALWGIVMTSWRTCVRGSKAHRSP